MVKKSLLKSALLLLMIVAFFIPQSALAWSGSLANSDTKGHGKITIDAFNDPRAAAFKSYMNSIPDTGYGLMQPRLLEYVRLQDTPEEKAWVARLDDPGNPACPISIDIYENEANDKVQHVAAHAVSVLKEDKRLHNALEILRLAIYWKKEGKKPELQFRLLGNGLHLLQDYFAHLNSGRVGGQPHGVPTNLKVDNDGDGIAEKPVGDIMDGIYWDNHSNDTPNNMKISDAFNLSYWHKVTNMADNYRYQQSRELSIKYMNAFMAETEADFVRALDLGFVENGNTSERYYINYFSKVIVDNDDYYCTYDSPWTESTAVSGYYGNNYRHDGTSSADSQTRWVKFTAPVEYDYSWYTFLPGKYEIYMRWAASSNRHDAAPLEIQYDGGIDTSKTVNQQINGGKWNYIGTYKMVPGNYVKLLATDEGYTQADAVMFVKVREDHYISAVTSSSSHEGSGWSRSNAADRQRSSMLGSLGWSSQSNLSSNHTEWITVELGGNRTVSRVDLYPRNDAGKVGVCFPKDFTISVSTDNVNWTTVVSESDYAKPGNEVQSFTFSPQSARYIKIQGTDLRTDLKGDYRMQFAEIEVY